jgi:hypothetical protein
MLEGLLIVLVLTALVAGVTGAFSPCGFSMVDTIGSALGRTGRSVTRLACVTFSLGAVLGGVLTFGGLSLLGHLVGAHSSGLGGSLGALVALGAAIADWRGVRIAPQIRRQVPERWRWTMPLPLAGGLYGVLLGLGFTTFVLSFAVWALAGISVAVGSLQLGLAVGVAFGLGRALPVIYLAPAWRTSGSERLERAAAEPRLWLGLRRLDALGLLLAALLMSGTAAQALTLPGSTDPSVSAGELAWQPLRGPGELLLPTGEQQTVPGIDPALGEAVIAWYGGGQITVGEVATMTPKLVLPAVSVTALAVSEGWLVFRDHGPRGGDNLIGVSLTNPGERRYVAGSRLSGEIGRPSLEGSTVVFTVDTRRHNTIASLNLESGQRQTLRSNTSNRALLNPSLLRGQLLYESVDRCAQELRLGPLASSGRDQVLLSLPSTVERDAGYEAGYEAKWNSASGCPNRSTGAGGALQLGPTALGPGSAYVTEFGGGQSRIIKLGR